MLHFPKPRHFQSLVIKTYNSMSAEEKKTAKKNMLAQYLPKVKAWEAECDNVVYSIIDEIKQAFKAENKEDNITKQIEDAYFNEKKMKKTYFINKYMD